MTPAPAHETEAPLSIDAPRRPTDAYRDAPGARAMLRAMGDLREGECYEVRWTPDGPTPPGWMGLGAHTVYRSTLVGRRIKTEAP